MVKLQVVPNINAGDLTAAQINNIYEDIRKMLQTPKMVVIPSNPLQQVSAGDPVKDNDGVNYSGWDPIRSTSTNISTNRLTVAGGQQAIATASVQKQRQLEW